MKNQKDIEQLQQTIKFYETLLRVSNNGVLITDASRNIIEVNDAFCSFIGQNRKVVIESNLFKWLEIFSEDAAENWIKLEKAVQSKQVVRKCEFKLSLNNEIRYFDVNASLLEKIENEEQGHIISTWHDITERKKAEQTLQEGEKKYRNLVENIEEGIASVDESEKFIYVNPATTKIFGYSEKELLNMTLKDFTTPEEFQKIIKQTSIRKNGRTSKYELNIITKDGSHSIISITSSPLFDNNNKFLGAFGILEDITERKQAENLLVKSEKKYRDLFEKSEDAILIIHNGEFVDCNHATLNMLHYNNKEELLNTHPSELSPEKQPDGKMSFMKANKMIKIALKNGSHRFEWNHKKSDGEVFPVEVLLTSISADEKNQILHTVWRDITERKKAEEAIRESEEKYRSLTEHLYVGVYRNTVGVEGRFIEANPAIVEMFGFKKKNEFLRMKVSDLYKNPEERKKYNEKMTNKGFVRNEELQLQKNDGTTFMGSVSAVTVKNEKGNVKHYDGIIEDITERKQAEEALRESEDKYRLLAENTIDCVWKMDKDLKFIYINQVIFSMLGFTREEWMGSTLAEHCSVKELQHFMNIVEDELRKEDTYSSIFELTLFHKDGREVPLEVMGKILFDKKKEIIGFQGNARNITERKKAEKDLKKKMNELEIFNDAAVDRELIINESRKEINELLGKLGKDQKYEIVE